MVEHRPRRRCAIYTRKSTEEGLEQAFNSLDAQREACAAYILSQASEGWEPHPELYDDGGFSGGNMDRPGLKQLLADVAAGKIDIIVVYKVDRLTRSLADFAKIVEILDSHDASFVSVTQSFNTTTSMGRLTLNVLLSFAQFEREVTGERIRDKIAASKQKGMWMGGAVPLGYRVENRCLLIDEDEAKTIRYIFNRYVALKSVPKLVDDLAAQNIRTRTRVLTSGRSIGGVHIGTGALALLLKNPVYIGKTRHKENIYDGAHMPLISTELFDEVQSIIAANCHDKMCGRKSRNPSLLTGMLFDPDGRPMSPCHAVKQSRRYRYYATRLKPLEDKSSAWRMPSGALEKLVIDTIAKELGTVQSNHNDDAGAYVEQMQQNQNMADALPRMSVAAARTFLLNFQTNVAIGKETITVTLQLPYRTEPAILMVNAKLVSRGTDLKLVTAPHGSALNLTPDPVLLKLVAQSFAARDLLISNTPSLMVGGYSKRHLAKLARLSWLAPDIISAIIDGRQPAALTGRRFLRASDIPLDWASQRAMFGFI